MRPGLMVAFLGLCVTAYGQQVNLSHDLVTLGIATKNLTPNSAQVDAAPLFQAALNYAQQHGTKTITVDRGAYYFSTPVASDRYMTIQNASNLTIDLQGSDLYMKQSYLIWLTVIDSSRVTLQNFTLDSQQLPFTQVRLSSVSANQRVLNYTTTSGWPSPTVFNTTTNPDGTSQDLYAMVFRNGVLIPGTNKLTITRPLQAGVLQVQTDTAPWTQPAVLATYQPGDTIVLTARGSEAPILIAGGDGNVLRNVDVYSSGAIAVHLDTISNALVDNVRVLPRPGTDRLISSNADGIHLSYALANNVVRNSFVSHTLDDGIAINSPFLAVVTKQNSTRQVKMSRTFNSIFPNGMLVSFVSTTTAQILGSAHIVSQTPAFSDPPTQDSVTVNVDQDLPTLQSGFGMIYGDASNRGSGSVIENNLVEDVLSARGIYLGGVSGISVEHNLIRRTNCGAIVGHQDLDAFPMGPNQDIQVVSNTIEGAIGPSAVGTGALAAIASIFFLSTDLNFNFVTTTPNTNIVVENNQISNSGRGGVWISNVSGGSVQNNSILHFDMHPELASWGLSTASLNQLAQDATQAVVTRSSTGLTVQNNFTQQPSRPYGARYSVLDALRGMYTGSLIELHQ